MLEIVMINIGGMYDSPTEALGILNTLFNIGFDDRERADRLQSK